MERGYRSLSPLHITTVVKTGLTFFSQFLQHLFIAGDKRAESDLGKLSLQWSSRDAPSHSKLKVRSVINTKSRNDLKKQLEEKEATLARKALKNAPENSAF